MLLSFKEPALKVIKLRDCAFQEPKPGRVNVVPCERGPLTSPAVVAAPMVAGHSASPLAMRNQEADDYFAIDVLMSAAAEDLLYLSGQQSKPSSPASAR